MKRILVAVGSVVLGALGAAWVPVPAQEQEASEVAATELTLESPALWFVELKSAPVAEANAKNESAYRAQLQQEKLAFRVSAALAGIQFKERFAYDVLWNGLSIEVSPRDLLKLSRLPEVAALYPVETLAIPPRLESASLDDNEPQLFTAIGMSGANTVQGGGITGQGIRVAVMDTGIDYNHADLGGPGFPNSRVVGGFDFVGDAFNASGTGSQLIPVPDPDPMDCHGHGTHVAGIVGANGTVTGVAPGVTFNAYKVFGCTGSTTADIMLAAMERTLADGNHILNMSIGSAFQWPQYPTARGSDNLVNRGVTVVASAGNSGANGLYSMSAPGVGKKVIGVGSIDNTHLHLLSFTISPDNTAIGYIRASGAPPSPLSGSLPMSRTGTVASTADACSALTPGSLTGTAALIRRGTCAFYTKAINAQNAGAAAVVLYNNAAGFLTPTVAGTPPVTIPVVFTDNTRGALIDSRLAAGPVTLTWTGQTISLTNATGGLSSSFSSYGVSPDLVLKPDITAPGGSIFSTLPLAQGAYGVNSGTSMSSPHVAGTAALLLEARPNTPSQVVRDILQNTASPRLWWGNPGLGFLDNIHRQGAGLVRIDRVLANHTKVTPGKLSLGESEGFPVTRTLTLENNGPLGITYDLSHAPALATGASTFSPSFINASGGVAFSSSSVFVAAGGTATVDVTFSDSASIGNRWLFGGFIVLTPQGGGETLRVPYAAFKGDYQSIVAVPSPVSGQANPALRPSASFGASVPVTLNFTNISTADDLAFFLLHLDHQVRRLRLEVFATSGRAIGRVGEFWYFGRNSTATTFFLLTYDATDRFGRPLPSGNYFVRLSIQKALGEDGNPAHWETWDSPVITVIR